MTADLLLFYEHLKQALV